jgi:hypothetical protein
MKRKIILLTLVILILVVLPVALLIYLNWSYKNKISQCPYIDTSNYGIDVFFEDCFGVISIERRTSGEEFYLIQDDKHKYTIENVDFKRQYGLNNGYLYIYRAPDENFQTLLGNDKIYYEKLFKAGEIKTLEYENFEKISKYMKVDVNTGEVSLYSSFVEMSSDDSNIFRELVNKNKDL